VPSHGYFNPRLVRNCCITAIDFGWLRKVHITIKDGSAHAGERTKVRWEAFDNLFCAATDLNVTFDVMHSGVFSGSVGLFTNDVMIRWSQVFSGTVVHYV
jgi:hypothetical protein